ncbi:hypothetical protein CORT_0B03870 [Candida orthopsilosis Co 90-125]|uniref:Uncharacterized protein n=1 Tax=Candida orthopsilosis (strain 90-125) TaxID=1136231 RepID=H8X155_CANO9|nr:hypothetical protein CORT_0B03870 [Candida orthopsilosis Co 90-125]CCG22095.1 hypothetical protein CORT_0B03870 [Candida orthopsilosis Co 90-125]
MAPSTSPTIHNFTLKKYSKFDHNSWSHHPYRTDLSITFIEATTGSTNQDIDIIIHWKGSHIDKYTLFMNDKVKTSILVKSPNIGIKQCVSGSGDLIFRFQISLVDDAEFEKCRMFLQICELKHAHSPSAVEGCVKQDLDFSSQVRESPESLKLPYSNGKGNLNNKRDAFLTNIMSFSQPNTPHYGDKKLIFDMHSQVPLQHQLQLFESQSQTCPQQQLQSVLQQQEELASKKERPIYFPTCVEGLPFTQPIYHSQTASQPQGIPSQTQQSTKNSMPLQQMQHQFLNWQQQLMPQQNMSQQRQNYQASIQPQQSAPPVSHLTFSQHPLPDFQGSFLAQNSQKSVHVLDTSVNSVDPIPFVPVNDLKDLESLTDSELRALISKQCQSDQFRNFVKRLDKIIEKNS